jgi:hypothetical protein
MEGKTMGFRRRRNKEGKEGRGREIRERRGG